eukprot:CAMPEP_0118963062 /NCGR_PEP_ID=MMETSP1173-20130426/1140_1 /TAXON_ID=1034831 /ORGANISM="Rhizochromulina marina cf, Strain CCMP1243" /LENGTH=95 /DNA_ID=CAMNT_0006911377 /DNA_START=28 /DNA_END=312 /DNA_ORIENTATION=-
MHMAKLIAHSLTPSSPSSSSSSPSPAHHLVTNGNSAGDVWMGAVLTVDGAKHLEGLVQAPFRAVQIPSSLQQAAEVMESGRDTGMRCVLAVHLPL